MGALALAERRKLFAPAARHWPLVFLGLAAFLFLRADEAAWPLGRIGFFDSLRDPEIAHTPLALVGVAAGWSRWLELRLDEGRARRATALVWPNCFVLSGLLLLFYREA
jgi:copper resistance protein D